MGVEHLGFIVAAYGVTAACLVGTVAVLVWDYKAQQRLLRDLNDRRGP